ncbi:MAG TPA: translation initiation factor IF-2 associated domain-containing protein, partial [Ancylobacter sp.]
MTDTKNPGEKTMGVGQGTGQAGKTLTLKRPVEQGVVRQSFSHGRSKSVVVEKVKRRILGPGDKPEAPASAPMSSPSVSAAPVSAQPAAPQPQSARPAAA